MPAQLPFLLYSGAGINDYDVISKGGYPWLWDHGDEFWPPIKDIVREEAGNRCVRCGHPYTKGAHGNGEWSPCEASCRHFGPIRIRELTQDEPWAWVEHDLDTVGMAAGDAIFDYGVGITRYAVEARWRILTVHHLNGNKLDCRWWNLAALCQRCHLTIQGKVKMERPYDKPHSAWFLPYVGGHYAAKYLGEELTREEVMARIDELLALELRQDALFDRENA